MTLEKIQGSSESEGQMMEQQLNKLRAAISKIEASQSSMNTSVQAVLKQSGGDLL